MSKGIVLFAAIFITVSAVIPTSSVLGACTIEDADNSDESFKIMFFLEKQMRGEEGT